MLMQFVNAFSTGSGWVLGIYSALWLCGIVPL